MKRKDGSIIYVSIAAVRLSKEKNMAFCSDITARMNAEKERREIEERFRRAVIDAPFPMILHAENGEIIQINRVWTEFSGYDLADMSNVADWARKAIDGQTEDKLEEFRNKYLRS